MSENTFKIEEYVYSPKHKLSGKIINKYIFYEMGEATIYCLIEVDNKIFGKSSFKIYELQYKTIDGVKLKNGNNLFVNSKMLKSTNPSKMYNTKIRTLNQKTEHLQDKDIKYGNVVSFIDNEYFERISNGQIQLINYDYFNINQYRKINFYLNGNVKIDNGIVYACCVTDLEKKYRYIYIPIDCLKLTKRMNKLKYYYYKLRKKI